MRILLIHLPKPVYERMKDVAIRQGNPSDAEAIAAILQHLGWFTHLHTETPEQAVRQVEQHIRLCQVDRSHSIYVAERVAEQVNFSVSGHVLGYVAVHWLPYLFLSSPEGYISELFVHSDYHRQGIGQDLLQAVISEASDRGCSRLMLVNSKQRESRHFYIKQGWREREHIANFIYPL